MPERKFRWSGVVSYSWRRRQYQTLSKWGPWYVICPASQFREGEVGIFCLFLPRFNLNVCNATKTPSSKYAFVSKQNNVFTSPKEPQHESALTKECG